MILILLSGKSKINLEKHGKYGFSELKYYCSADHSNNT